MLQSHAKAAGHAIHQQLIVFPLGLLVTAVVFDAIGMATGNGGFTTAAYYMIAAGVLSGVVAAAFGAIDYLAIPPGTRAKRVGLVHGVGNEIMLVLFAISWFLRPADAAQAPGVLAFLLGVVGLVLSAVTGWLGGELVGRLGVGVDPDANLNAPATFETHIRFAKHPGQDSGS